MSVPMLRKLVALIESVLAVQGVSISVPWIYECVTCVQQCVRCWYIACTINVQRLCENGAWLVELSIKTRAI
jgi:hypothetical protein